MSRPQLGRDFAAADGERGAMPVASLSDGLGARRYARDPAVLGTTVRINGTPVTIVGVMPAASRSPTARALVAHRRARRLGRCAAARL